jgi:hypothetical protein
MINILIGIDIDTRIRSSVDIYPQTFHDFLEVVLNVIMTI